MRILRVAQLPAALRPNTMYLVSAPGSDFAVKYVVGNNGVARRVDPVDPGDIAAVFNSA